MKRLSVLLLFCSAVLLSSAAAQSAYAQDSLSEAHINRIRQNCSVAQTALRQLYVSDGGLRVNRGDLYANISDKLMAPLNSRITLGGHEGLKLIATTLEYDRQLDSFRASYKDYYASMESQTLKINCVEKPVEFYESVKSSREKRQKLHEDSRSLITLLNAYKTEFESFAAQFEEGNV